MLIFATKCKNYRVLLIGANCKKIVRAICLKQLFTAFASGLLSMANFRGALPSLPGATMYRQM